MSHLQMTFRHMETSGALQEAAERELERLERTHPGFTGCEVTVEQPHTSHRKGGDFRVHVEALAARGVGPCGAAAEHEDAFVAMQKAFERVGRQLERPARRH